MLPEKMKRPKPRTRSEDGERCFCVGATLQGAIFALVKAAVDRGAAKGTRKLLSVWPGANDRTGEKAS